MSQLLFLSVVDVFECSEEAADALQISSHTSDTGVIQPLLVQPTADNWFCLMLILNVRKKGKEGGNKSHLKSGFPPPYMPIS